MKLWEDFKAWRRGEKRIKGAVRGRCFVRKDEEPTSGAVKLKLEPTLTLQSIRVIRKDGTTEEIKNG